MIPLDNMMVVGGPLDGQLIQGSKGGGSSSKPRTPVESPDSLHSVATARILDLVSEGEIVGLVNGMQSVYLSETPMQNPDLTLNFPGVNLDERKGTQSQSYIKGFPAVENEIAVGVELKAANPWVRSITNNQLSGIRVRISTPRLVSQDPTTGDQGGTVVNYRIDLSVGGGPWSTVVNTSFSGKTTTKYERSHRIDLPESATGWQVRVVRLTDDSTTSTLANQTYIEAITEVIDAKFKYPNSAVIGVEFDSAAFQSIPTRAYHLRGRKIRVPINYDPDQRIYTGVWNGTFKIAWTDNPAWIYYDLIINDRYGLGHIINANQVDKWQLYQIAQYCDQMVSDGKGGQEPRFTCNLYLQTRQQALKVLQDLSGLFRGMSYWGSGQVFTSADMPTDPVYTYTNANVKNGKFTYSGTSRRSRFSVALVSWNDPNDFYRSKVEYVEDRESLARFGHRQTDITAFACSSQGQAQRLGRWTLLTNKLETETVNFSVGLDGVLVRPGQVIRVADNNRAGRRIGGRLRNATTTVLVLDASTVISPGDEITTIGLDGVAITRTVKVVSAAVTWDKTTVTWDSSQINFDEDLLLREVTLDFPLPNVPAPESMWALDSSSLVTQQFRVIGIKEDFSDGRIEFNITATKHVDGKYGLIDDGTRIDSPPITVIPPSAQKAPENVTVESDFAVTQGIVHTTMGITWDPAPNAVAYEVQWKMNDKDWVFAGRTGTTRVEVPGILAGRYLARVMAFNALGVGSAWATSQETELDAVGEPVPALSFLTTESKIFGIRVRWGFPEGLSTQAMQRTELWYSQTNDLNTATKLGDYAYPQSDMNLIGLSAGQEFYFWARLVDKIGNIGPWSNVAAGISSIDSSAILEYLSGQITESELGQSLLTEIGYISGTGEGSVDERLNLVRQNLESQIKSVEQQLADLTGAPDWNNLDTYAQDQMVKHDGSIWQAITAVPANTPPPNATYWRKVGDYESIGEMVTALAAEVDSLKTQVTTLGGNLQSETQRINTIIAMVNDANAAISNEATVRANADTAFANQVQTLLTMIENNSAAITTEQNVRAQADNSLAEQMNTVVATVNLAADDAAAAQAAAEQAAADVAAVIDGVTSVLIQSTTPAAEYRKDGVLWIDTTNGNNTPKRWNGSAWVAITDKVAIDAAAQAAAAAAAAAQAQSTANKATAAVQTQSQALADTNGKLAAMYTIKTSVTSGGKTYIAGIGVGVENNNGVIESQVIVAADRFAVVNPNGNQLISPFVIQGGQVFINSAVIQQATVVNALVGATLQSVAKDAQGNPLILLNMQTGAFILRSSSSLGKLTIWNNQIQVHDANGVLRVRLGLW